MRVAGKTAVKDLKEVRAKKAALADVVRQWIAQV